MVNEEQSVYTDDYDDGFNKFFEDIKKNPQYGRMICRCESITEGEIVDAKYGVLDITIN